MTVAPARRMPWKTVAKAGTFGQSRPSTVLGADAARRQRTGERIDLGASAPYVVSAPVAGSMSATRASVLVA